MKPILLLGTLIVATLFANNACGQRRGIRVPRILINDVEQSAVAMHPATPFLEPSSLLVVDIDITKIDVEKAAEGILQQSGQSVDDDQAAQSIAMAGGFIESLKGAGVSHIYVTAAPRSFMDGGPILVIPCENPALVNGLAAVVLQAVPQARHQVTHVDEKLVLIGPRSAVDRVRQSEGAQRGDLLLPMKNADLLDHTAVVKLADESREDLIALWPDKTPETFPVPFSPRAMVSDIRRFVVTCRLPPEAEVIATIETTDVTAAKRVRSTIEQLLALSAEAKDVVTVGEELSNVIVRATPDSLARVAKTVSLPMKKRAARQDAMVKLKQIGLAMHRYFDVNNHLPPRCLTDRDGKPLLSWRVTVLPYLEQLAMHRQFHLNEPWDSQHNQELHRIVIPALCIGGDAREPWKTRIRVPVYPGSLWHGDGPPRTFRDVKDGTVNTIAAIDAPENASIEWSNPEPWVLSEEDPASDVFGNRDAVTVLMLDGSARVYNRDELTNEKLKVLLTIDGGEVIER